MVLSDNGDHPMTKLGDTPAVILSAASQREDGTVLPLPETLKIKGGAVDKMLRSLKSKASLPSRVTLSSTARSSSILDRTDRRSGRW